MSMNVSNLLQKYQEQNSEIIKNNVKLNERIAFLEKLVSQLQQENLELRIHHCRRNYKKKKPRNKKSKVVVSISSTSKDETTTTKIANDTPSCRSSCRTTKSVVNYAAPSLKAKLRKGDPHTFSL